MTPTNKHSSSSSKLWDRCVFILLFILAYTTRANAQKINHKPDSLQVTDTLEVRPLSISPVRLDTIFPVRVSTPDIKLKLRPNSVNIYDLPYSISTHCPNYKMLGINTGVLFGMGFVTLGVLNLLPDDATSWNREEITNTPFFKRWVNNVKKGPVVDKDNAVFNYILHPYGGAAYYMSARSQGFNLFYSFLYMTGISTIFWEYGIEAFMEVPSIQDLVITPFAGLILGETFYLLKRHIVENEYTLLGSRLLGNIMAYLIDPVNEVIGIFSGNPNRKKLKEKEPALTYSPWVSTIKDNTSLGFTLRWSF